MVRAVRPSVVTKSVPPRCVVAGNPARILRENIEVTHYGRFNDADQNEHALVEQGLVQTGTMAFIRRCLGLAALGLVLANVPMASASGETSVAAFGTSLTQRGNWPEFLIESLDPCVDESLTMIRIARAGAGSDWAVSQLSRVVAADPSIVLVEFAINDADILDGIALSASRRNHLAIIDGLRAANPQRIIVLLTMNPAYRPRGLTRPFLSEYYQLYRDMAERKNVHLIDLHPVWLDAFAEGDRDRLMPDGLHPTDAAFNAIALPVIRGRLAGILGVSAGACP